LPLSHTDNKTALLEAILHNTGEKRSALEVIGEFPYDRSSIQHSSRVSPLKAPAAALEKSPIQLREKDRDLNCN